jgi:hypothetical protein
MADSNYAQALPVAMDAVKEGQDLFKPQPDLRLFPLFLLGAQVNIASYYHEHHTCQCTCEHPKKVNDWRESEHACCVNYHVAKCTVSHSSTKFKDGVRASPLHVNVS